MQIHSVGIDLGKTTFHLVALGDNGKVLLKKKFTQKQLIAFTANMQTCLIGMEACSGSHFLGKEAIPEVLENVNENLTPRMRNLVAMLWSEWKDLELQIVQMNDEVERIASSDAACRRLRQIPGIGPLVATAIVASIGNGAAFRKG